MVFRAKCLKNKSYYSLVMINTTMPFIPFLSTGEISCIICKGVHFFAQKINGIMNVTD